MERKEEMKAYKKKRNEAIKDREKNIEGRCLVNFENRKREKSISWLDMRNVT